MTAKHTSGSPASWKARREAYRKNSGPVSNPNDPRIRAKGRRWAKRFWRREQTAIAEYRQSIHCGCDQCLPGQDRECPAREPNVPDPNE